MRLHLRRYRMDGPVMYEKANEYGFVIGHYVGGIYRRIDTETLTLGITLFKKPPNNANATPSAIIQVNRDTANLTWHFPKGALVLPRLYRCLPCCNPCWVCWPYFHVCSAQNRRGRYTPSNQDYPAVSCRTRLRLWD